jgi:thiazole synthase/sulfur carrier protein
MPPMQTIDAVELVVNGEQAQVPPGTSVERLLDQLKLDRRKVAVELNEAIVPRSTYADTMLRPGDRIEIVHFIGGG